MFDFGLYTQVSDSGPHGPLILRLRVSQTVKAFIYVSWLNGYLGGKTKVGSVEQIFTTTEAEDVKRFICSRGLRQ